MTDDLGRAGYELYADTDGLIRDLGTAERKIKESGQAAEKAFDGKASAGAAKLGKSLDDTGKSSGRLKGSLVDLRTGALQGAGIAGFLGVASAAEMMASAIVAGASASVQAASALRESVSLTDQVFKGNSDAVQEWARTTASSFGQSQREAQEFASGFGGLFANVGFALDDTTDKSKTLTRLAADLGSAFNASSQEAAQALKSGLLGESEPLKRFNVFLSESAVQAKAVELGIAKAGKELSTTQKVAARYAIIMEQTAASQGMFGRDSESLADAQKSLGAIVENLAASIGEMLLPVANELVKWARDEAVPALQDVIKVAKDAGPVFEFLGDVIEGTVKGPFTKSMDDARALLDEHAEKTRQATTDAATAWGDSAEGVTEATREMNRALAGTSRETVDLADTTDVVRDRLRESLDEIRDKLEKTMDDMRRIASGAADAIWDPIILMDELAANSRELTDQRRILSSKTATEAEKADARARIHVLEREQFELKATASAMGLLPEAQEKAFRAQTIREWARATGAARRQIQLLIDELYDLGEVARDSFSAVGQVGSGNRHRAAGGWTPAGWVGWVGENGPELRVEPAGSYILNRNDAMAVAAASEIGRASSAGAGGTTWNGDVVIHAGGIRDPYELGRIARNAVLDALRYEHR